MAVIGLIAQGEMGTGIGGRLAEHGHSVLTVLDGRSDASARRAAAAGMMPASWQTIAQVDMFISLVPPSEALPLARRLAPLFKAADRAPLYADLNAVSPRTAQAIAETLAGAGCTVADGGICGPAPEKGKGSPAIFVSGPGAAQFGAYRESGLDIRVMDAPIGAGSAVKICQSGFTKGYTALASVMALAAMRFGAGETLRQELLETRPGLIGFLHPATMRMFDKAYRYAGEMQEIADFVAEETAGKAIFEAFDEVYRHLAEDRRGPNQDIDLLRAFYEGPAPGS
jgi:3-hydroxyisobutyrate dehydrogenase-like beta-hydroxyacid dehydrogenase